MQDDPITMRTARIIDLARWAPSGDNTQPWRFTVIDENRFIINSHDTRAWCVYDLEGRASQIALGTLLENISIAASKERCAVYFRRDTKAPKELVTIEALLTPDQNIQTDPLLNYIPTRVTKRRPFSTKPLSSKEKKKLESSVGDGFDVIWFEGWRNRLRMAHLLFGNAKIRLTIPEAYAVHKEIIEWGAVFSEDKIPEKAVGVDPWTAGLMRWGMQSWDRVCFLNKYLGGTLLPRIELDVFPALGCAAHFILTGEKSGSKIDDQLNAGRKLQRFWLTATSLGLQFQPEMTPLIFSEYIEQDIAFTVEEDARRGAYTMSNRLEKLLGRDILQRSFFMGRLGFGKPPSSRSIRLPSSVLIES